MVEVKKINRILYIIVLVKILGGLLCRSYSMIASCLLDLFLIIISKMAMVNKEDSKGKKVTTTLIGLIMILSGVLLAIYSFRNDLGKVSAWIIFFGIVTMMVKYMINCFYTNVNYRMKSGILSYGTINSSLDFITVAIFIVTMILSKSSKWVGIFKYADVLGTILIVGYLIYRGVRIIINSFKTIGEEKKNEIIEKCRIEIEARKEIKKLSKLSLINQGGLSYYKCGIILADGISMIDANTFVVTLQDYLLKFADVVKVDLVDPNVKPKHVKVRSLKEDARNSRSRNGKTNSKKKNSTKKNKKR